MRPVLLIAILAYAAVAQSNPDSLAMQLAGEWAWVWTESFWGPLTPASQGYSMTLRLAPDTATDSLSYWSYMRDSLVASGKSPLQADTTYWPYKFVWKVALAGIGEGADGRADALRLYPGCCPGESQMELWQPGWVDCCLHRYERPAVRVRGALSRTVGPAGQSTCDATYDLAGRALPASSVRQRVRAATVRLLAGPRGRVLAVGIPAP